MSEFDIPSAASLRDGLRTMIDKRDAELARLRAALAGAEGRAEQAERERDALIEKWPEAEPSYTPLPAVVNGSNGDRWRSAYGDDWLAYKAAAVRAAAGLDAKEGMR
jgi:hypothetical protein